MAIDKEEEDILKWLQARGDEQYKKYMGLKDKRLINDLARRQLFLEQFTKIASKVFKDKVAPSKYSLKRNRGSVISINNLILSDLHFGSWLDGKETPYEYGPKEEARRLAKVVLQCAEFKQDRRGNTVLFVHLLGDTYQGQLHDQRDGAPKAQQLASSLRLLVQALAFLASHYPQVIVRCVPGNHGRNLARHPDRAAHQKWDADETFVYVALAAAVSHLPNIRVEIPYSPYYTYSAFGQRAFMTHGDTVLKPGYPGKTINTLGLRNQINEINGKLDGGQRYRLFAVGHVHTGTLINLPNGAKLITNGCLVPPDGYSLSIGCLDNACGQWMWESVPGHILGDARFIEVDEYTDKDKSLEKIIKPVSSLQ